MSALWVVVPAHQEAARIGATLDALAAQRDRDFTLVVMDNASTDGTAAIAHDFAAGRPSRSTSSASRRRGWAARWTPASGTRSGTGRRCRSAPTPTACRAPAGRPVPAMPCGTARAWCADASTRAATSTVRRDGPPSAPWSARPRASGGYARPTTAATATSPRTGCTPATTWPSPPRGTKPSAACPAAPPPPTRPSTGNGPWRADGMTGPGRPARPRSAA
ncbi:glycosyltransferase family 2 protein [Streptomyces achromogenes]|uniref:glycosyltransferase family 2 protein n=1 Tax=Streptomyces achromogenes TaxID=67255 RepID=UPI0037147286